MTAASGTLATAAALALVAMLTGPIVRFVLRRRDHRELASDLALLRWPGRALALALFLRIAVVAGDRRVEWAAPLLTAALVLAVMWTILRALCVSERALFRRLHVDVADNLRARSRRTQITLLRRVVTAIVVAAAVFVVLVAVTPIRELGTSLVAYAGLIGVVLGFALRAPIENLVGGLTVAITEPIRIDDIVVVEDEWGRIEQIGLANVIVRAWDDRRIVLPTSYFVTTPFQNWTRRSAEVTGSIHLWVDYTADIEQLRAEFERIVDESALFDGRHRGIQVVELGEQSMRLRGLVTAQNAAASWDLRCEVRERLLEHLAASGWLPRVRMEGALEAAPAA